MIDEYITKTKLAITEGLKKVKKGLLDKNTYYKVLEVYFNNMYEFVAEKIDTIDDNVLAQIFSLENSLDDFIVDFETKVDPPYESQSSDDYLLETIVYFTRKQLRICNSVDLTSDSLRKYDSIANKYVNDMCERLGLACYSFNVARMFGIPKNHYIAIVNVNNHFYLIDTTYQQYFLVGHNFSERYLRKGTNIVTKEVGTRILNINKEGAIALLTKGYVDTDDQMFEDYFSTMLEQFNKLPYTKEEYLQMVTKSKKRK